MKLYPVLVWEAGTTIDELYNGHYFIVMHPDPDQATSERISALYDQWVGQLSPSQLERMEFPDRWAFGAYLQMIHGYVYSTWGEAFMMPETWEG